MMIPPPQTTMDRFIDDLLLMVLMLILVSFAWAMGAREERDKQARATEFKSAQL